AKSCSLYSIKPSAERHSQCAALIGLFRISQAQLPGPAESGREHRELLKTTHPTPPKKEFNISVFLSISKHRIKTVMGLKNGNSLNLEPTGWFLPQVLREQNRSQTNHEIS
uniref:Uncharacterized protein n=1 Tax=Junco hyemalis TaxID=40217 RepID=A0A8C5JPW2_JUNHY